MSSYDTALRLQTVIDSKRKDLEKTNGSITRNREKRDVLELEISTLEDALELIKSGQPEQLSLPLSRPTLAESHVHAWGEWEEHPDEHLRVRHCACGKVQRECMHEYGETQVETWETPAGVVRRATRTCRFCSRLEVAIPHQIPPRPETPEELAEYRAVCTVCGAEPDPDAEFEVCRWETVPEEPVMDLQAKKAWYGSAEWNADKRSWDDLTDLERERWNVAAAEEAGRRHYIASPLYAMTQTPWADIGEDEQDKWTAFALGRAIVEETAPEESDEAGEQPASEQPEDAAPFEEDEEEDEGDDDPDDPCAYGGDAEIPEDGEQPAVEETSDASDPEQSVEPAPPAKARPRKAKAAE